MDDFSNDAANRSLDLAVLTIGPNRYYSNSTYSAGYILHKYSHYYVPAGQSIPGGSPTIRMALCFEINTNDLSNETATLSMFDEEFTVDLTDLQTIDSVDGVYAVEENPAEELNDSASGSIRIKLSPTVTVKNGVMQDLNFCNYNEERLMSCKIMVGGQCAYESGFLVEGKILTGDFIDTELLQTGEQEALAEIYSFDLEKKPIGQTNVKIKLVVE